MEIVVGLLDELEQTTSNTVDVPVNVLTYYDPSKNSSKFWIGTVVAERFVMTWWGRRGSDGQTLVKSFNSRYEANEYVRDLTNQKLRKGYETEWHGTMPLDTTAITLLAESIRQNTGEDRNRKNRQLLPADDMRQALRTAAGYDPTQ